MRRVLVLALVGVACLAAAAAGGVPGRFMQYPTISGDTVVFTYEGDLWSIPAAGGTARRLTSHPGTEEAAKLSPDGKTLVFTAEYDGAPSLYVMPATGGSPRRLTYFGAGVQAAGWTPDGRKVVFRSSHEATFRPMTRLYTVSPEGGLPEALPMDRGILCTIQSFAVSNDGRATVFEARGDVLLVPADDKAQTKNLTGTTASRERYPQLSPDGSRVAFFSDKTGSYQLYVTDAAGKGPWEALTTALDRTVYHLEWSPDGTKILFGNKDFALFYVDVATKKLTRFASSDQMKNDEFFWEVSDYSWSPDSQWITYSFVQFNRNNQVFLYSLEQNRSFPVTTDFYDSLNPSFDASGDYLYFLSYRNFDTRIDIFEDDHVVEHPVQVMALQLKTGQRPPYDRGKERKEAEPFRIDLAGIQSRVFPLPIPPGLYFHLKAGKGLVTYDSVPTYGEAETEELFKPGGDEKWTLHVFDMASQKDVASEAPIVDWRLSANREQMIVRRSGPTFLVTTPEKFAQNPKSFGARASLDQMSVRVRPVEEWTQIFNDTWRWYNEFFYDANMHGHDWKKWGDTLRAMVPDLSSRGDLNWLLSQMVGELNVSHTYIGGGDMGPQRVPPSQVYTGLLGADLEADPNGGFRLAKIFGPTAYNADLVAPLVRPDVTVKEGDYLVAIDGHALKAGENPYQFLQVTRGQRVSIAVNSKPTPDGARTYEIEPIRSEAALRYNRWLAGNIDAVLQASNGEIGYMHIQAMSTNNIGQFDKFWRAFRYKKGLIIDVRGNGGGWTEYFIIDKLERKMTAYNVLRGMVPFRYPGSTTTGQIAVLSNEYNGSDGEAFLEDFKARKLGTVIGVPSWGGLVGILNRQLTVDNGTVEQSNNAFYNDQGKWLIEGHGGDPDVVVDNDPASAGRDVQLERAIAEVQKQIKAKPFTFPPVPKYPIR